MKKFNLKSLALVAALATAASLNAAEHRSIVGDTPEDRSGWIVTGCSQQNVNAGENEDGGLNHIIDDNVKTFWHTSWSGAVDQTSYPHYIIFDRGEDPMEIGAFGYTPRQNSTGNGFVTKYRFYAVDEALTDVPVCSGSQDCADPDHVAGIAWADAHTPLIEGTFDIVYSDLSTHGEHLVELPSTTSARYLVFVIDDCSSANAGMFANCAEFRTYKGLKEDVWNDPQDLYVGKQMKFKNVQHNYYIGVCSEENTKMGFASGIDCIWDVIDAGNGKVKLYNGFADSYAGPIIEEYNTRLPLVKDEAEAGEWEFAWADNAVRDCITIFSGESNYPAMHMVAWDGIVRWTKGVDASHFVPSVVDESDYEVLAEEFINSLPNGELIGKRQITDEVAQAIEALRNNPKDLDAYRALEAAANAAPFNLPEAGKYYTLTAAQAGFEGKKMIEPYVADSEGNYIVKVKDETGVPALWQFTSCAEPDDDLYVISAANTGKSLAQVTFGKSTVMTEPGAENEGHYDLTNPKHGSSEGVALIRYNDAERSDYSVAKLKDDNSFDSYKDGLLPWKIEEVTEVSVALNEGFGSLHFPFAVAIPEGVTVYTLASIENFKAIAEPFEGEEIPANTAVIFAADAESVSFPIITSTADAAEQAEGVLLGLNAPAHIENAYVIYGNAFYPCDPYEGIPANSAYIIGDGDNDVTLVIPVSGIALDTENATLEVGETLTLEATVTPANATEVKVTWKSSNEAVATVSASGEVTAVAPGEAEISASCGGFEAVCKVTVNEPAPVVAESVVLSETTLTLVEGESATLTATVLPEEAEDKTIVWTSSNELVATVSAQGEVSAIAEGTAVITATCGEVSAECAVTVEAKEEESMIEAVRANFGQYEVYDLAGRRVNSMPARGVYMIKLDNRTVKITL